MSDNKLNDYLKIDTSKGSDKPEAVIVSAKDEETADDYIKNVRPNLPNKK